MNLNWFKNPDHVVYADVSEFVNNFARETGISDLKERIEDFEANPTREGVILKGKKRTSIRLFVPDLIFEEHIEMGENIWVYMGENYECYCLYNVDDCGYTRESNKFKFFAHEDCEYFPCHEIEKGEGFNCLFCYCPLYAMGRECGGNYRYLSNGIKDCSGCLVPHRKDNYDYITKKLTNFCREHV